ncbi:MAG: AEC family transporter, partial [Anaerotignaceae bacterium]
MATEMVVLIGQMKILASLIIVGIFFQRAKIFTEENIDNISVILTRLILPCMVMTVIGNGGGRADLIGRIDFFIFCLLFFILTILISYINLKFAKFDEETKGINVLLTSCGNGGFIGIPLVVALFPETAGLYVAAYIMVEAVIFWVVGPIIAEPDKGKRKIDFKKLVTPLTVCVLIGILVVLLNLNLKGLVFWDTLAEVGSTSKYFAAIYIGADLGRKGIKSMFSDSRIFITTAFKLFVFPMIAYLIFGKTGLLTGDALIIFVLLFATPSGMALPIIARMVKANDTYAT